MCQPSPLNRCSSDASAAYEKSQSDFTKAIQDEKTIQLSLKSAHANYTAVSGLELNIKYGKSGEFGSEKDPKIRAAGREIRKNLKAWDEAKEDIAKCRHDVLVKRMHFDSTPAGNEELINDSEDPDQQARLKIVATLQAWQQKVAEIKDADGNAIASKKGKASPEAKPVFAKLLSNARSNHSQVKKSFETANRDAIRSSVQARNTEAKVTAEVEENPGLSESEVKEKQDLVEKHKLIAAKARLKMRTKKLELVMYDDRNRAETE
jgi:hypothetical protein